MSTQFWVVWFAVIVFFVASAWRVFAKAGKPGWACLVPIYNGLVLLDMAGKPRWWFFLYLIPFVNIVIAFKVLIEIAHRFGKSTGFGVGLALLGFIFFPILAFGDAEYRGG